MVVVSDTTTITNLIRIDLLFILHKLYGQVIIPEAVYNELAKYGDQKNIIAQSPWIQTIQISNSVLLSQLTRQIDRGEAEAIVLAIELESDYLIIDEKQGRKIAKAYDLQIIGLLGILVLAKRQDLISNVKDYLDRLRSEVGFRISDDLYKMVLKSSGEDE